MKSYPYSEHWSISRQQWSHSGFTNSSSTNNRHKWELGIIFINSLKIPEPFSSSINKKSFKSAWIIWSAEVDFPNSSQSIAISRHTHFEVDSFSDLRIRSQNGADVSLASSGRARINIGIIKEAIKCICLGVVSRRYINLYLSFVTIILKTSKLYDLHHPHQEETLRFKFHIPSKIF